MIYVYAIVDDPGLSVAGERGLGAAPLELIGSGQIAAVCSVHAHLQLDPDPASLWRHERVTAALMARCAVAPVRFGTVVADAGQLVDLLASQRPRLASVLARLRGRVELALRASAVPTDGRPPGPDQAAGRIDGRRIRATVRSEEPLTRGRAYLRSLSEDSIAGDATVPGPLTDLDASLSARAVASSRSGRTGCLVASYLVEATEVPAFRDEVARVRRAHPEVRVSLTGPWAPFSFVEEGVASVA